MGLIILFLINVFRPSPLPKRNSPKPETRLFCFFSHNNSSSAIEGSKAYPWSKSTTDSSDRLKDYTSWRVFSSKRASSKACFFVESQTDLKPRLRRRQDKDAIGSQWGHAYVSLVRVSTTLSSSDLDCTPRSLARVGTRQLSSHPMAHTTTAIDCSLI